MAEGGYNQVLYLRETDKPVCNICKQKVDIQLNKCLDCNLYLCDKCVLCHKEIPLAKNHTIIPRVECKSKKILETSRMCSSHPSDEVLFHCSTCKRLICSECKIGIHKKHKCIEMKDFAKEKRQELKNQLNRTKDILPAIKLKIAELSKKSKNNDTKKRTDFEKLKARKIKMQKELEKINKKLEAEYENIYQKEEDGIVTTKRKLTQDLSEIETMWSDFTKILHTGSDLEAIQAQKELSEKLESIKFSDTVTESHLPTFIKGKADDKILEAMYGSLDICEDPIPVTTTTDPEIISQFDLSYSGSVLPICPFTDNTALVHYTNSNAIDTVTADGNVQQTLHFDFVVDDFILTSEGHIMSTHAGTEPAIFRLTQGGVKIDTISTAPLQPVCLCESRDGNLLVSLVDVLSMPYNINQSSRRCVSRMTMKGEVLESYEYNKGSRLFTKPTSVSENINRDVCVVNRISKDTGHLIILDHTGKLKSRYYGKKKQEFDPCDVKCDKSGNIIMADCDNQTIHLLDTEGKFIRYIITENNFSDHPLCLAIDNKTGILWVGVEEGDIYTIRYQK